MKYLFCALIFFISTQHAFPQAVVDWYDFTGGVGIATDVDNNVYSAHYDYNPAGDIYLTKRNQQGSIIWQVSYNQTDNTKWEQATYVETDRDGNIFVSGTLKSGYSNPVNAASIIMKFDSSGTLLWRQVYETGFDGSSTKQCLTDATGNVYILGSGTGPLGLATKIKKYDSAGNFIWNWYDIAGIGAPVNFKFTPDSNLIITCRGVTGSFNGYARITTGGTTIWSLAGIASLSVGDAAGDANGNTYCVSSNAITSGSTIKKISLSGSVVWSNNFSPINAFFVEVGTDNMPVIGGYPSSGTVGAAFMKADSSGTQVWYNPNGDSAFSFLSHARMRMDNQNNIYLAAGIMTAMGVCRVNSNGSNGWAISCPTGYSQNFRIGNDQAIYVVGGTTARIEQVVSQQCQLPENIRISYQRPTSFTIKWDTVPYVVYYEVQYKASSASVWQSKIVDHTKNKIVVSRLTCGVPYLWKLRAVCDTTGTFQATSFTPEQVYLSGLCKTASEDFVQEINFDMFPNPASDKLNIKLNSEMLSNINIQVVDVNGKVIRSFEKIKDTEFVIDVSQIHSGIYFVKVDVDGKFFWRKTFVSH